MNGTFFESYLANTAIEIDSALEAHLERWLSEVRGTTPPLERIASTLVEACVGGKRIRGALVKLGYELAGRQPSADILNAAVAYELYQTALLAHDDIIDRSYSRRGRPAIYRALGGDHRAVSHAICLGDVGFHLANCMVADLRFSPALKVSAFRSFADTMLHTAMGQILDVEMSVTDTRDRENDIISMFSKKTARYTVTGPMHLGAILGGGTTALLRHLVDFGTNVGIAFQIRDDILGVFGDEAKLGKSNTSDIDEGKATLLISYALRNGSDNERAFLKQWYGRGPVSPERADLIRAIFVRTGALVYAKHRAGGYSELARRSIAALTRLETQRQVLQGLVDYLAERER